MFGLPKETSLEFVVGCELQQIAFSLYQLILVFSNDVSISIESNCQLESADGCLLMLWEAGKVSDLREMRQLFDAKITEYEIPGDGSVILRFNDGSKIGIQDTNVSHESYQITGGGRTVVV